MTKNDIIEPFIKLRFNLDRLSLRDRAIILFLTIAGLVFFWYLLSYVPQSNALRRTTAAINSEKTEAAKLIEKSAMIESLVKDDTVTKLVAKYSLLQSNMRELDNKINRYQKRFIDDKQLSILLHTILKQTTGVSIIGFSNETVIEQEAPNSTVALPAASGTAAGVNPPNTNTPNPIPLNAGPAIEEIRYTLILTGTYFSLLDYLEKLEQTDWQFYWNQLNYHVDTYPEATVTIEFYTLRQTQPLPPMNTSRSGE